VGAVNEVAQSRAAHGARVAWQAFGIFLAVGLGLLGLYAASAGWFADLSVLRGANAPPARFNAALALVLAYVCAALWLGRHWVERDLVALRGVAEAGAAEWEAWTASVRSPAAAKLLAAALAGAAVGLGVTWIGRAEALSAVWRGHSVWARVLTPALFAAMGVLLWRSASRARLYRAIGLRTRVRLGELAPLAVFVGAGLRTAGLWFVGTSLACLLLVDMQTPNTVVPVLVFTTLVAAASLLTPSRGVHVRLREAKRAELAWLRAEIARAADALRAGDAARAAPLPALIAWEGRVADAPEWPIDASAWRRFALLLLVPLGSWLGGALAEWYLGRFLDS
jgi:hypothetical protein